MRAQTGVEHQGAPVLLGGGSRVMSRKRSDHSLALGAGGLLAGLASIVALFLTGSGSVAAVVLAGCFAAVFVVSRIGPRAFAGTAGLFLVAPGVFGETSFVTSAIGAAILFLACLSHPPTRSSPLGAEVLLIGLLATPAIGMAAFGAPVSSIFGLLAITASLALARPAFVDGILLGVTWGLGLLAASYVASWTLGQFSTPLGLLQIGGRTLQLHFPFTVTAGGEPFIPGTRRMSPLTGEPGLAAFFALPLIGVIFAKASTDSRRAWSLIVLISTVVLCQSFASVLAVVVAISLGALAALWRRGMYVRAACLLGLGVLLGPPLATRAVADKATVAAASFTDRGIANLGSASQSMYGNINLLVAFGNDPFLAIAITVGLLFGLCYAVKTRAGLLTFVAFGMVAIFAQPSQWHPGGWFLLAMALIYARTGRGHQNESEGVNRVRGTGN